MFDSKQTNGSFDTNEAKNIRIRFDALFKVEMVNYQNDIPRLIALRVKI